MPLANCYRSVQVEEQNLGVPLPCDFYFRFFAKRHCVASAKRLAVHAHVSFRHMNPGVTSRFQIMRDGLAVIELCKIQVRILVDRDTAILSAFTCDQVQFSGFGFRIGLLAISGSRAAFIRRDPDLQ